MRSCISTQHAPKLAHFNMLCTHTHTHTDAQMCTC